MWKALAGAALLSFGVLSVPAYAQSPACAGIEDRNTRLECYDRASRARPAPQQQFTAPSGGGSCTRSSPCTGPRGGIYYYTASGRKQYMPR
jgi:hypothetical protein